MSIVLAQRRAFPLIEAISADALFRSANPLCRILAAFCEKRNRISPRSGNAYRLARRFPQKSFGAGTKKPAFGFWMVSVQPKRCTFSFQIRPEDIRPGSSGRIVNGYRARILDEHGVEVAEGESGQLFISGDSTARCYWNNVERTATTMVDGWLNTGDTYRHDAQGYFYYCGRSDDMLKVGGIWCSPFEIEIEDCRASGGRGGGSCWTARSGRSN